jgi:hypothetical protein
MKRKRLILLAAVFLVLLASAVSICVLFPRTQVTRENFLRLRDGMTEAEVEEIFGERSEPWHYNAKSFFGSPRLWAGDGIAYVTFDTKRGLVGKCWKEDGFFSPTKDEFGRVRHGMTFAEVREIFGRAPATFWSSPNEVWTGRWPDIDGSGVISFESGIVRSTWWEASGHAFRERDDNPWDFLLRSFHLG